MILTWIETLYSAEKDCSSKQCIFSILYNYREFKEMRITCTIWTLLCYNNFIHPTEISLNIDTKHFWNFVNSERQNANLHGKMSLAG